jgi:hypothetical protein
VSARGSPHQKTEPRATTRSQKNFVGIIAEEIGGRKRPAGAHARTTKIASRLAFVD